MDQERFNQCIKISFKQIWTINFWNYLPIDLDVFITSYVKDFLEILV